MHCCQNYREISKALLFSKDKRGDERGAMERTVRFGDWSEHTSSSGKKYYYNCKTEVSQWEKPREWIVRTESRQRQPNDYSSSRSMFNSMYITPISRTY